MIPITAAIVGGTSVGEAAGRPRVASRPLTFLYVLGLALVYSGLGLFAGLSGTLFGAGEYQPMAVFHDGESPRDRGAGDDRRVAGAGAELDFGASERGGNSGRASGAFTMGAVSGLVAAPCSAPVMAAVLTWVSTTKSATLGFLYLFVFSLGMCTLLVVVGLSSGAVARLPRAGMWMVWVKRFFAFVMLGVAEYYLVKMGQLLL
jgi:thiol:disulfide interchange protein DsbD